MAAKFADNGSGRRGDLGAVVKAILLDAEARDVRWSLGAPEFGRLKEPVHRAMAIARLGRLDQYTNLCGGPGANSTVPHSRNLATRQACSTFSGPSYQPPGLLTQYRPGRPGFPNHRQLFQHLLAEQTLGVHGARFVPMGRLFIPA